MLARILASLSFPLTKVSLSSALTSPYDTNDQRVWRAVTS